MVLITETDKYLVYSQGNGLLMRIVRKHDGADCFLQGDDASVLEGELDTAANVMRSTGHWRKLVNQALSEYDQIMSLADTNHSA